jgi:hypothetical protein
MKIYLILLLLFFYSCESVNKSDKINYYYLSYFIEHGDSKLLETKIDKFEFHNIKDSLIFKKKILIGKQFHELRKYSNCLYSPVDGERITYELDSVGVIFSISLSWYSMKKLRTSNDSINALIDRTLDFSLIYSELNNENNFKSKVSKVVEF